MSRRMATLSWLVAYLIPLSFLLWYRGFNPNPEGLAKLAQIMGMLAMTLLALIILLPQLKHKFARSCLRHRRALGLLSFFYISVHGLIFMVLEQGGNWRRLATQFEQKSFLIYGPLALLFLIPLAVTSNSIFISRLGLRRWKRLHKLIYVSLIFSLVHVALMERRDGPFVLLIVALVALAFVLKMKIRWQGAVLLVGLLLWGTKEVPILMGPEHLREPLSFPAFEAFFLKHQEKFKKMEDLLAELPSSYREKFTLVHHSKSRQAASVKNPRVIFYGHGVPELILTMTGEPGPVKGQESDPRASDKMEMISWNERKREFEFREIVFPGAHNDLKHAELSEKNPQSCRQCHGGDDLRPNWQHYNQWPGAFDGDEDNITEAETAQLDTFFTYAQRHPRYRFISGYRNGYAPSKVSNRRPFFLSKGLHNSVLLEGLADLNFRRIVRILQGLPEYGRIKNYLLYLLMCSKDEIGPASSGLDLKILQLKREQRSFAGSAGENSCVFNYDKYDLKNWELYSLLALAIQRSGGSFEGLFMDFIPGAIFSLAIPGTFERKLAAKIIGADPSLRGQFPINEETFGNPVYSFPNLVAAFAEANEGPAMKCEKLGKEAQDGFAYLSQVLLPEAREQCRNLGHRSGQQIRHNCQSCHQGPPVMQEPGSYSKLEMARIEYYISEQAHKHRMPPNRAIFLTESEQKVFMEFLRGQK